VKFVADLVPATRRVVPAGDGETTLDEETALIAAIDRVLDVVSVGWEQLLAQAPELTVRVGSTPESATGGIDLALQFAGTACRRFVARSGASAARIRIFEAAVRERLLLTRPGLAEDLPLTQEILQGWAGQDSPLPMAAIVIGLLAEVQVQAPSQSQVQAPAGGPGRRLAQEAAVAVIELAGEAIRIEDDATDEGWQEVELWRDTFRHELAERELDWPWMSDGDSFPPLWDASMRAAVLQTYHPLQPRFDDLAAILVRAGEERSRAKEIATAVFCEILVTAEPTTATFAAAGLLAPAQGLHPAAIWTPRLLVRLRQTAEPVAGILDPVLSRVSRSAADFEVALALERSLLGFLVAILENVTAGPDSVQHTLELRRHIQSKLSG